MQAFFFCARHTRSSVQYYFVVALGQIEHPARSVYARRMLRASTLVPEEVLRALKSSRIPRRLHACREAYAVRLT